MAYVSPFKQSSAKEQGAYVSPFSSPKRKTKKQTRSFTSRAADDVGSFFASIPKIPFAIGHIAKAQSQYRKKHPASKEWAALFRGDTKRAFPKGAPATEMLKEFTTRSAGRTAARVIPGALEKHIGLKPRSILKEYGEHPVLGPMEDITNFLMLSGAAKATGLAKATGATKATAAAKKVMFKPVKRKIHKALVQARHELTRQQLAAEGVGGLELGLESGKFGVIKQTGAKAIDYALLRSQGRKVSERVHKARGEHQAAVEAMQTSKLSKAFQAMPNHERGIFVDYLEGVHFEPVKKSAEWKTAERLVKNIAQTERKTFLRQRLSTHEIVAMVPKLPKKTKAYFSDLLRVERQENKVAPMEHQLGMFSTKDVKRLDPLPSSKRINVQRAHELKTLDNQRKFLLETQREVDTLEKAVKRAGKTEDVKTLGEKRLLLERENTKTLKAVAENRRYQPLHVLTGRSTKELKEMGFDPVRVRHFHEQWLSPKGTYLKTQPAGKARPGSMKRSKGIPGAIREPEIFLRGQVEKVTTRITDDLAVDIGRLLGKTAPAKGVFRSKGRKKFIDDNGVPYVEFRHELQGPRKGRSFEHTFIPETFDKRFGKFTSSSELMRLMKAFQDPFTKMWRLSVLSLSPRWVFNNFVGNVLLNTMGGVGPTSYVKSAKALTSPKYAKALGLTGKDLKAVQAGAPYSSELAALRGGKVSRVIEKAGRPLTAVNEKVEKWARLAHYIDKRGKGFSRTKAIKSVNEFLFDYLKLSPFEKQYVRSVVPFYVWTKNISRLAATYPVKHPYKAAVINKLNLVLGEPEKEINKKEFERFELPVGKTKDGKTLMLGLRGVNPFADVLPLLDSQAFTKLHPLLKVILEQMTGIDLLRGKPFQGAYPRISEAGEEIIPRPPVSRHILSQFPQYQMAKELVHPEARYFATDEPILTKEGKPLYKKPRSTVVGSMFGVKVQPRDLKAMEESKERKKKYAESWQKSYEKRLKKFEGQKGSYTSPFKK